MKHSLHVCRICGSDDFYVATRPMNLLGRYCAKCGAFDGYIPENIFNFNNIENVNAIKSEKTTIYEVNKL